MKLISMFRRAIAKSCNGCEKPKVLLLIVGNCHLLANTINFFIHFSCIPLVYIN